MTPSNSGYGTRYRGNQVTVGRMADVTANNCKERDPQDRDRSPGRANEVGGESREGWSHV
jgi:hypothetical protein